MEKYLGKIPKPSIKCWGCKGEHMHIYCPHKGDKMRIMHNIQEDTIVKETSRNI